MSSKRIALAAIAAAAVVAVAAGGVLAHGDGDRARQGYGQHHEYGGHYGGSGHPGMMMGHGHGTPYGMMGPGSRGHQMIGPGYRMGPGMMMDSRRRGHGGMGPGMGPYGGAREKAGVDDVRTLLERRLAWHGNPLLKVGDVKEAGEDSIVAEIVTAKEGAVVERFAFDRNTGFMRRVN